MSPRQVFCCLASALALAAPVRADGKLVQRAYAVADLVVPVEDSPPLPEPGVARPVQPQTQPPRPAEARVVAGRTGKTMEDVLIATIKSTVAPRSWREMGGEGTADYFPLGMALVINQTPDVHEQIAELLAALRRSQDTQVAVEIRLVTLGDAAYDRLLETVVSCPPARASAAGVIGFCDDAQLRRFFEAAQADRSTRVMQTPKVTTMNGQRAAVDITEQRYFVTRLDVTRNPDESTVVSPVNEAFTTGLQVCVRPTVSADRRYVRLHLKLTNARLAAAPTPLFPVVMSAKPFGDTDQPVVPCPHFVQQPQIARYSIDRTLVIPDGGTAILGGWKENGRAAGGSCGSLLGWLPYVGLFFDGSEAAAEPATVLVMVTPRIIHGEAGPVATPECPAPAKDSPTTSGPAFASGVEASEPPAPRQTAGKDQKLARLLEKYYEACRAGRRDEAQTLALKALVIDPTCFGKRGPGGE